TAAPDRTSRRGRSRSTRRCRDSFVLSPLGVGLQPGTLVVELHERVAELLTFGCQIACVLRIRVDLDRHLLDDRQAVAVEAAELPGIVREDPDGREAEVGEDLVPDPPLARVRGKAELEVRLDGIEPIFLQLVRAELVEESDPTALLRHVEEDAPPLG